MHLNNPLQYKQGPNIEAGELFIHPFGGGYALAILLKRLEDQRALNALLEADNFSTVPVVYASELAGNCLSYGVNWALDIDPGKETFPQNTWQHDQKARLFIDGDAVALHLPIADQFRSWPFTFDLRSLSEHKLSTHAAPVYNWRIWQSKEDMNRNGAKPIFQIKEAAT